MLSLCYREDSSFRERDAYRKRMKTKTCDMLEVQTDVCVCSEGEKKTDSFPPCLLSVISQGKPQGLTHTHNAYSMTDYCCLCMPAPFPSRPFIRIINVAPLLCNILDEARHSSVKEKKSH